MLRVVLLLSFLSSTAVLAQDAKDADAAPESSEQASEQVPESAAEKEVDDLDDPDGLDEPYPVEDEDAFIPSENVAFGQSIPFPTDI
jgi:hypothetical protein